MTDQYEIRRRRLLYQSKRRGSKEADMVIGQFAIEFLCDMTSEELDQFESLLQESDPDLMTWASDWKHHRRNIKTQYLSASVTLRTFF